MRRPNLSLFACLAVAWFVAAPTRAGGATLSDDALDQARRAAVCFVRELKMGARRRKTAVAMGTGVFVGPRGHVLTSSSAAGEGRFVKVRFRGGGGKRHTVGGEVLKIDRTVGLALVKAKATPAAWLLLADAGEPREKAPVWALHFPVARWPAGAKGGPTLAVHSGAVAAVPRGPDGAILRIETDITAPSGIPGGPLVDAEGRVLGVTVRRMEGVEARDKLLAAPAGRIEPFIRGLTLTPDEAYGAAAAFAKENPRNFRSVHDRYMQIVRWWPDSARAKAAAEQIAALLAEWQREAGAELARLSKAAEQAAEREDYEAAVAALRGFPERLLNDQWSARLDAAVGAYAEAKRLYDEYRARKLVLMDALWKALLPLLRDRNYATALATAQRIVGGRRGREAHECTAAVRKITEAAGAFWQVVADGAARGKLETVRLKGMLWQVKGVEGPSLVLTLAGAERRVALRQLPLEQAVPIALAGWTGDPFDLRFALACLHAFERDWTLALRHADAVAAGQRRALRELIASWRSRCARELLTQADDAFVTGLHKTALAAMAELRDHYAETDVFQQNADRIESAVQQCELKLRAAAAPKPSPTRMCPKCTGTGKIPYTKKRRVGMHYEIYKAYKTCPTCKGKGRIPR